MKFWKCPECHREHETPDNIVESYCAGCLELMIIQPYNYEKQVVVEE